MILEDLKGKFIYFKTIKDDKDKIGTIKEITSLITKNYMVEAICNGQSFKLIYDHTQQIEKSIGIAEEILIKRRERLENFFVEGKDKQMIKQLKNLSKKNKTKKRKI